MTSVVEESLERVRAELVEMGGRVEEMIADATRAMVERDSPLAESVIRTDPTIDTLEKRIDENCILLLALQEPKAIDFRNVIAVQKIVSDLERMGDSAVNIAQAVLRLNTELPLEPAVDLPALASIARRMVRDALDSFVRRDAALARQVCERDDQADDIYRRLFNELVASMKESSTKVDRALQLLLAARNLERIADHATNIAEDVIFYLEAQDVRHTRAPSAIRALDDAAGDREPPRRVLS
jgi:phosphate transport system protein